MRCCFLESCFAVVTVACKRFLKNNENLVVMSLTAKCELAAILLGCWLCH